MTDNAIHAKQEPVTADFIRFRQVFPALNKITYMSICDKMILADPVRARVETFLDRLTSGATGRVDHEHYVQTSREKFATLVNASAEEVSMVRNVSDGINTVIWALGLKPGDNAVVCFGAEHPNNIYPWLRQRERDLEIRVVEHFEGRISIDAVIDAIDERTRIVSVASVSFAPGYRTDIERLASACRLRDIFLLVDGVQSAGILHHDFANEAVDGFATSTSKGLLGLYGCGFLYVARKWRSRMNPAYLSRTAVKLDNEDASVMGEMDYQLQDDGRRFEVGSYNLAGAYAADAALELIAQIGTRAIQNHVLTLSHALREGLAEHGLRVNTPAHGHEASHIITCGTLDAGGHGFSHDPLVSRLYDELTNSGVVLTIRRGQLRFGLHAYNSRDDVEKVLGLAASILR